jgi:AcrR family transcriptional regulator
MPRLSATTAAKRRNHIIMAALQCFHAKGFAATSVDDICAAGGISKGAFYAHYASKEALIHAVAQVLASELGGLDATSLETLADSLFDRQIAPAMPRENARFGLEMMAASASDPVLQQQLIDDLENVRSLVEGGVRDLQARGLVRPSCDPAGLSWLVQRYLLGALTSNAIRSNDTAKIRAEVRALLQGLAGLEP